LENDRDPQSNARSPARGAGDGHRSGVGTEEDDHSRKSTDHDNGGRQVHGEGDRIPAARHQLRNEGTASGASGDRRCVRAEDHRWPSVRPEGQLVAKNVIPQATYDKIKDSIIAAQKK
jgi:hypothetical protein